MSRKTKVGKRSKDRKKRAKQLRPYAPVKMRFFEMKDPFGDAPTDVRRKAIRASAAAAKQEFSDGFSKLHKWFDEFDAVYVLAFCVYYFMTAPQGVDKEVQEGRVDFAPHHVELLQALALMKPRAVSVQPLLHRSKEIHDAPKKLTDLLSLMDLDLPEDITDEEFKKRMVASQMRTQTMAIRNWAYPKQEISHGKELFAGALGKAMADAYGGLDVRKAIAAFERVTELINTRLNAHLRRLAPMWAAKTFDEVCQSYRREFPNVRDQRDEMFEVFTERCSGNLRHFKEMLITHADLHLVSIFSFTHEEFMALYGEAQDAGVRQFLDSCAMQFGDLKDFDPKHFLITNPVLSKPLVKLESDHYFWALGGIFSHTLPLMLEAAVPAAVRQLYLKSRSNRLEDLVEGICRHRFPSGTVYRSARWSDGDKQYETDVLVILDTTVLIFECKSGLVDPPARRGGELRLVETLKDLVLEPTIQAYRLIKKLKSAQGTFEFSLRDGSAVKLDTSRLSRYVPVSVTYENLGFVSGNLKESVRAGLIKYEGELAPSICVMDLEVISILLDSQAELIHYLSRRAEIERTLEYFGDEQDLLALYLESGFNIATWEEDKLFVSLAGKSKELDPYFTAAADGVTVPKPRLELSDWWRAMVTRVEQRSQPYWTDLAYALLSVLPDDQHKFEYELKKLAKSVREGKAPQKHNWVTLGNARGMRRFVFVGYPYKGESRELRNEMLSGVAGELLERGDIHAVVLIAHDVEAATFPYDFLGYVPRDGQVSNEP